MNYNEYWHIKFIALLSRPGLIQSPSLIQNRLTWLIMAQASLTQATIDLICSSASPQLNSFPARLNLLTSSRDLPAATAGPLRSLIVAHSVASTHSPYPLFGPHFSLLPLPSPIPIFSRAVYTSCQPVDKIGCLWVCRCNQRLVRILHYPH